MKRMTLLTFAALLLTPLAGSFAADAVGGSRQLIPLSGDGWQFVGAGDSATLPEIGSDAFHQAAWTNVTVPHNFQTRSAYDTLSRGWYRRQVTVDPAAQGKALYLVFEGAATIADVYVNGQRLGQHRGAYTRFVVDATQVLHPGADNQLAVLVDDRPESTADCLPVSLTGLYKIWGGLYRNVWLVTTDPVHIDPTDAAAPGVYLTPKDVSEKSASLGIRVLLRNASASDASAEVRARILDPNGKEIRALTAPARISAGGRATVALATDIAQPQLWEPLKGRLYQVQTGVYVNGHRVDEVTESTGFRWLDWDWKGGKVTVNGKRTILYGVNLHQEIETKGSAVSAEELTTNFDFMQDLGINFLRLCHYPHARLEYDLCDQRGILCWAENGNSNSKDVVGPSAARITIEMVKQNYNHPSIVVWSMGNEAAAAPADQCVPIVKALDSSRPVGVANMKSELADFHTRHCYFGWYHTFMQDFQPTGFISEVGAGGVVTTHCDYNQCDWKPNKYEPEEWQQLVSENNFQKVFHGDNGQLGLFCLWILRDMSDGKYKAPVGINSKGLLTYAGDKKDIYYLYRSFLRPDAPTVWITSKRYFLRRGAADNGIKVYSNAKQVTLTLNGENISTLANGQYVIPNGPWALKTEKKGKRRDGSTPPPTRHPYEPVKVDNVFYWPVSLHTGKNVVTATDDRGHSDTATIYFYGEKGLPAWPVAAPLLKDLTSSNPTNSAYYMDLPVQAQWPVYYDLDSTADNSMDLIPDTVQGATWLALRRVTKPGQATDVSFTLTRPATISVLCTKQDSAPAALTSAHFSEVNIGPLRWRGNDLILVPAQLYARHFSAGERVNLSLGDRDALVLFKAD
jgi:beta-galactosidase